MIQHITNSNVNFYVVDKRKRKEQPVTYTVYEPDIADIEDDIKNLYLESLTNNPLFRSEQVDFDVQRSEDDVLERCEAPSTTFSPISALVNSSVENPDTRIPFRVNEVDFNSLNLYIVKFSNEDTSPIYFIRRFNKFSSLNRGLKAIVRGNSFSKINEKVWGFESTPDLIFCGEEALIISRYGLSVLCEVDDFYIEAATNLLEGFRTSINNFDDLLSDSLDDRRTLRRLVKLAEQPDVARRVLEKTPQELQNVIDVHGLTLNFDELGILNYSGEPGEAAEIILLLADAYYVSSVLNQPGRN